MVVYRELGLNIITHVRGEPHHILSGVLNGVGLSNNTHIRGGPHHILSGGDL